MLDTLNLLKVRGGVGSDDGVVKILLTSSRTAKGVWACMEGLSVQSKSRRFHNPVFLICVVSDIRLDSNI